MKLYPPIIDGTLPAFCNSIISIPFAMNRSVNESQVAGFVLKMKTVQNQNDISSDAIEADLTAWNKSANIVSFDIGALLPKIRVGQFYKVQLAYKDFNGIVGYYSTVGIIKYTSEPKLSITSIDGGKTYIGTYSQKAEGEEITDFAEKVYTYCFTLMDNQGNIIETSGEQIHNSSQDTEQFESIDIYTIKFDLEKNKTYFLEYKIKTNNNLEKSVRTKNIMKVSSIDSNLKIDLKCEVNFEEGYVDIKLQSPKYDWSNQSAVGTYYLLRASDEDNFSSWYEVLKFALYGQQPNRHLWKDMSIKQGVKYKYAIQQYNAHNLRSNRIESNIIYADFDHAFLYDGERQLKIKYNPKITSFKTTLMETKVDTIGNKYPFIFRNGNVNYKEFPISGLISYLSDENKLFDIENESLFPSENNTKTDLVLDNIYSERQFKLKVLDWLNNGKPKLFKSPTEGNYIVRLVNVSLSPNDTLGRMLHTFNCTAYEIAESNYANLEKYNFIKANNPTKPQLRWASKDLHANKIKNNENLLDYVASSIRLEGLMPGEKIELITEEENGLINNYSIVIGVTGSYIINLNNNVKIQSLSFKSNFDDMVLHQGILTYSYYATDFKDSFDTVNGIQMISVPCHQFIGRHEDIIKEINNIKEQVESIGYLKCYLRNADAVIYQGQDGKYYSDQVLTNEIDIADSIDIYKVLKTQLPNGTWDQEDYTWLDGYNNEDLGKYYSRYNSSIRINESQMDINLEDIFEYSIKNPENIKSLETGAAIITEICYQKKNISYDLENEDAKVILAKEDQDRAKEDLNNAINNPTTKRWQLKQAQDNYIKAYKNYCKELERAIQEAERR